jgi:GAF domain-containing protein/HAMP domain-containing protein
MMSVQKKSRTLPSLGAALTIAFLVLSVVTLLVAGGVQLFFSIRTQQESVARGQQFIAQDAANTVVGFVQEKFGLLEVVAKLGDPRLASQEERARHLTSLLGLEPAFRHLALLDVQGREVAESSRLAQTAPGRLLNQAGADALVQVQQGKRYIGPVYVDEATSEPMVIVAVPVIDVFGDFQGTLMAEVNLKFMWDLVDRLEVGEGGRAYVVDRYGDLIAFGDVARVLRGENVSQLNEVSEFISNPAPIDETGAGISTGINGTNVVATYVPLGTPDWAVVIELPVAEAYREVIQSAVVSAGVVVVMATLAGLVGVYMARRLSVPLRTLTETVSRVAGGEMGLQATPAGPAEVVDLARAFNSMTVQLRELIGGLEERVAARTLELERRSTYLEASAEVASAASSILKVEQLIQQMVELIRQRFSLYYVGLFLVDEIGEWAVLQAGTGEAGRVMLARPHRVKVGEGMIGWCVANAQPRIALDVGEDAVRLETDELPETRSEAALPLRARGRVVGALTVQSDQPAAFDQEIITVFQSMADQIAIALENARLFAESHAALEAAGRAYGELSREAWISLLQARPDMGYRSDEHGVITLEETWRPEMVRALQEKKVIRGDGAGEEEKIPLAVPIRVRGEVIGVLDTHKPAEEGGWTDEEVALLEELTDQLGEALEGARLYRDTQRRAAREQLISHVVNRMRSAVDMETLMQTTIREVANILGVSSAFVQLGIGAGVVRDKGGDRATDVREEQTG